MLTKKSTKLPLSASTLSSYLHGVEDGEDGEGL
jgi:hypothetical protein